MVEYVKHIAGSAGGKSLFEDSMQVYQDGTYTVAINKVGNVIKKILTSSKQDDQVIQAALNYNYYDPGPLFIHAGTYNLSSYIFPRSNYQVIRGTSDGTILKLKDNANCNIINLVADYCIIQDLKLDGNLANQSPGGQIHGISVYHPSSTTDNCKIQNVEIVDVYDNSISVSATVNYLTVEGCRLINSGRVAIYNGGHNSKYIGNYIHTTGSVTPAPGIFEVADNTIIENNIIQACPLNGINLLAGHKHGLIKGNTLIDCFFGIELDTNIGNCVIENNIIKDSSRGICTTSNTSNMLIRGNVFHDLQEMGIILTTGCTKNIIENNTIYNCGKGGTNQYGILVRASGYNTITGSTIYDDQGTKTQDYGIYIYDTSVGNIVTLNTVYDNDVANYYIHANSPTIMYKNHGYTTESTGTAATITAGNTYVDVTHSLAATPTKVRVTPTTNLGTRSFWVDTKGATTFRININSSDAINHTFDWEAEV
jgi:parallel beta-helix repeat protein